MMQKAQTPMGGIGLVASIPRKGTEMQNFQRLLESPLAWILHGVELLMVRYRKSVERRRDEELRRRFLNG